MRRNKTIKIFGNYFLGPLLFLWLLYVIYAQIRQQPHLHQTWEAIKTSITSRKIVLLISAVLLMLANWAIETLKWKISVAIIHPITFRKAFRAVLSGVSFSVSMPNRIGEYAGRALYLPEGNRLKSVPISLIGGISQLIITLLFGIVGLAILKKFLVVHDLLTDSWYGFIIFGTALVTVALTVFYFTIHSWAPLLKRWFHQSRHLFIFQSLPWFDASLLLRLLSLSFIRYIIFTGQYVLLFSFFQVHVPLYLVWSATAVLFLAMAVIPTIALAELGLRGQVSLQLMGLFTTNSLGVVLTSVTVWIINLMLPALAGSILILTLKVFKRTHELV